MNCDECGARGYSRLTKTPEWRCKNGHEWDVIWVEADNTYHPPTRCPACRTYGYRRKTMTPPWRRSNCGNEWDEDDEPEPSVNSYVLELLVSWTFVNPVEESSE